MCRLEAPIHSTTLVQDEEEDDGQESEESEEEDEDELRLQLKALRDHALVLQEKGIALHCIHISECADV